MRYVLIIICVLFFSCNTEKEKKVYHSDVPLSFSSEVHHIESYLEILNKIGLIKFGGINENDYKWLRMDDNMMLFHKILLNEIGYKNILSKRDYYSTIEFEFNDEIEWKGMTYNMVIDSLLFYKNDESNQNYYSKFWSRRVKEGNDTNFFNIVYDIKNVYSKGELIQYKSYEQNDTLFRLMKSNYNYIKDKNEKSFKTYFDLLLELKLNLSANNLIDYQQKIQKEEFIKLIPTDSIDSDYYWVKQYYDGVP